MAVMEEHKIWINDAIKQEHFIKSLKPALMRIYFPELQEHIIELQMRENRLEKVQDPLHLTGAARENVIHFCREFESGTSQWGQWEPVLEEFHNKHDDCSCCSIKDLHLVYVLSTMLPQESL